MLSERWNAPLILVVGLCVAVNIATATVTYNRNKDGCHRMTCDAHGGLQRVRRVWRAPAEVEHRYYGPINCADSVPNDGTTPVVREKRPINIGIK